MHGDLLLPPTSSYFRGEETAMHIIRRKGWEIRENAVTPEHIYVNRRQIMAAAVALGLGHRAALAEEQRPAVPLNPLFKDAGRDVTAEEYSTTYNNFTEFGSTKRISDLTEALVINPWDITFDGEIEETFTIGYEDLMKKMAVEERIYRHRCVETWAMTVPWTGFALRHLVSLAKPKASAKYIRFETFHDPEIAPGQKPGFFETLPWPYVEGVTMEEATNDLAFMVTGAYGKELPKSMGAPIRLHLPWKFGFKSIKSIVRVTFTTVRPVGFWEQLQPEEYGFWANVNPDVPHPRWSQADERLLGSDEIIPTTIYNGYGEYVADLYKSLGTEKLFM
jgi:sulfoxide reductase catalytic subunit YedY